ncbi:VanZ family protein [Salarchaeum sp. JOR-1]|uniref:VanZ family protein n=1 Tax=Salarchaeum sp. JOR-1 TaxID=2599399 RepID=UPI0011987CED|nr:VanZ family protein [Salarchaeum sp. JOR-1]QDX40816.1 hypothetical protein FQU85_07830 [Salarchaeum sp. JOR-1]
MAGKYRLPIPLAPTWVRWLGVLTGATILFYFSIVQAVPQPPRGVTALWDKQLHFAGYAGLGLAIAYATATIRSRRRRFLLILGGAIAYGVLIELLQAPLPNRYYSPTDMLANTIGALLATSWLLLEDYIQYVPLQSANRKRIPPR